MTRRAAHFTQADIARALRGVLKGGGAVRRVEVDPDGKIVVICAEDAPERVDSPDGFEARLRRARGWQK